MTVMISLRCRPGRAQPEGKQDGHSGGGADKGGPRFAPEIPFASRAREVQNVTDSALGWRPHAGQPVMGKSWVPHPATSFG